MASITIPVSKSRIDDPRAIVRFLEPFGIHYERWPINECIAPDTSPEEILAAYAPEIERLKKAGGYVTADVITVAPDTPGLEALLDRFNKEHYHSEDEVRFIIQGAGLFHIHPEAQPVFALQLEAGDLITVPAGMRHWFDLCADRSLRAIRLFQDPAGWTPHYVPDAVHGQYTPLCWGPQYVRAEAGVAHPVSI